MKRLALAILCLLAPLAARGQGGGLNLSWNGCGSAGVANASFACNTNSGAAFAMTGSFVMPPAHFSELLGNDIVLDLVSAGTFWPAWWDFFNAGACRRSSLVLNWVIPTNNTNCIDHWNGNAGGGITAFRTSNTNPPSAGPNRVRLLASYGMEANGYMPPGWDEEVFAFKLTVDRAKTIGAAPCGGCFEPVCVVLNSIKLVGYAGEPGYVVTTPATRNWVTWQGGVVEGGCPAATPAKNRTWGQLKSLYR